MQRSPELPIEAPDDRRSAIQHHSLGDSLLTDSVLNELKRQSTAGCLLCSLDELDGEDWD